MCRYIAALAAATLLSSACTGMLNSPVTPLRAPVGSAKSSWISPIFGGQAKRHGLVFVANTFANGTGEVDIFPQRRGNQIGTVTNALYYPIGLGVDSSQNLYVANGGPSGDQGFVTEYAPPYTGAPIATYTQDLQYGPATAVAIGVDGSVYVSESSAGIVVEYPPHSLKPYAELKFDDYPGILGPASGQPEGLALDANNDLYVAVNFGGVGLQVVTEVIKLKPGALKGRVDVSFAQSSGGATFDDAGNLLVERQRTYGVHGSLKRRMIPPAIFVFPRGRHNPSRRIDDHFANASALAFDRSEKRLYVSGSVIILRGAASPENAGPATLKERSAVYCVAYPSGKLLYTITYPAGTWILGVAATPPAPK